VEPLLQAFIPDIVRGIVIDDRIYGVPWRMDSLALYYRPDLLPEGSGAPQSWEDLLKTATEIADEEKHLYGLGLPGAAGGQSASALLVFLWGAGGSLYDEDGQINFTSPQMRQALSFWVKMARRGALQPEVLSWDALRLQAAFGEGKLGMIMAGSALAVRLRKEYPQLNFAVAALPYRDRPVAYVSATYLVIMRSSPHRNESRDFLKFVASRRGQQHLMATGSVPSHNELIAQVRSDPLMSAFTANLDHAHSIPREHWASIEMLLEDALYLALSGRRTPQEALSIVQQRWETMRKEPGS